MYYIGGINMNIDEIVEFASERKQESEEVPSRNIGELLLRLYTAGVLLFGAGTAISQEANADNFDNGYEIAQVVNDIDLSEYTKVAEEDGLEVYVSPIRRNVKNWDHVYEKEKLRKWKNYAHIWDIIFKNNTDNGIVLNKMHIESLTGEKLDKTIENKDFENLYLPGSSNSDKVYIPAGGILFASDDFYLTGDRNKKVKFTYFGIQEKTGKCYQVTFELAIN